jgi:catechol 2,3-dioxygenase-like lactoylglutathione lyase family enzyme
MFSGGNVTVYVADMDRSVRFYSEVLGLRLIERYGDHWAAVDVGGGMHIGLHPGSAESPAGIRGSLSIGFAVQEGIENLVKELTRRGVAFDGPIHEDKAGKFASFRDRDGNSCYLFELPAGYQQAAAAREESALHR